MKSLPRFLLDIPAAPYGRADKVVVAIREAGLDLRKAIRNQAILYMAYEWIEGRITRDQFISAARKVAILNGWI